MTDADDTYNANVIASVVKLNALSAGRSAIVCAGVCTACGMLRRYMYDLRTWQSFWSGCGRCTILPPISDHRISIMRQEIEISDKKFLAESKIAATAFAIGSLGAIVGVPAEFMIGVLGALLLSTCRVVSHWASWNLACADLRDNGVDPYPTLPLAQRDLPAVASGGSAVAIPSTPALDRSK